MKKWRLHRKNIKRKIHHHSHSCISGDHEAHTRIHHTLVESDEFVRFTFNEFQVIEPAQRQLTASKAVMENIIRLVENECASLTPIRESTTERENRRAYLAMGGFNMKKICRQF